MAADRIRLGEAEVIIAGGAESMSMIPMGGNKIAINEHIFDRDENIGIGYGMGITAEKVAQQWKVTREAQDVFATDSHRKALAAIESGEFNDEITPYVIDEKLPGWLRTGFDTAHAWSRSTRAARGTTPEVLAKLRPAFAAHGSVTAGNSSQTSDGAGAVILASDAALKRYGLRPLARFLGFAVAGVPPEIMGIGPKFAIPKVLKQVGLRQEDIDWIELNEAFAAQSLAVIHDLGLDPAKINPLGGAIALGHPLGATGAIRTATIVIPAPPQASTAWSRCASDWDTGGSNPYLTSGEPPSTFMSKITRIEVLQVDLQPKVARSDAIQTFSLQETPMLRLFCDDGSEGTGYSYTIGNGGSSVIVLLRDHLAPRLLGKDAEMVEEIWKDLFFFTHATSVGAITSIALCVVDTALWDRRCRAASLPLHVMAGGAQRRIPVYDTEGRLGLIEAG
jgi:hypothetical protein